ncbi:MAG: trypsin-like peptidase domain-containing protein [Anaerolineaceae bacterium]|nr:trypsin-like peptidase domain-containing protein [Anaerolineaceae bacterium]
MKKIFPILVVIIFLMGSLACDASTAIPDLMQGTAEKEVDTDTITEEVIKPTDPAQTLPENATDLREIESLFTSLYEMVSPGVVSIQTLDNLGGAQGSGFVYDKKGHIITNYHVVENAVDLEVDFPSGLKARGSVIGIDLDSDLAVIKVEVSPDDLYPVTLGDSDSLKVGQMVVAIGNPYGLTGTMTTGIISAKGRTLFSMRETPEGRYFSAGDLIQTDASINPGNSGGPLLNLSGEVIGINRAIRTSGTTDNGDPVTTGIGFAVSVNIVKRVVPELIAHGFFDYPYVGISAREELTLMEREALGLEQSTGAYIVEIVDSGPADEAGLRAGTIETDYIGLYAGGDLIIGVDDRPVQVFGDFLSYLMTAKSPGDTIALKIIRDNEEMEVMVTLIKRP